MTKPSRITHMVGCNLSGSKADKTLKVSDWLPSISRAVVLTHC